MRILFCGTILPERYETELKYLSSAANRFQWNVIKALREQGHEVVILSYVGFPLEGGREEDIVQSCRRTGIDVTIKKRNLLKTVGGFRVKLAKEIKKADSVWAYNVLYPWLDLGKLCSRNKKRSVLILADFSPAISYDDKLHKIYAGLQERSIRQFALVVGLSENVRGILKPIQKFMLMEGGIDISRYEEFAMAWYQEGEKLVLMYSGLLSTVTGVDMLLEAFVGIEDSKLELAITGKGELESLVREYEQADPRIHYYGQLSYGEYLKRLRGAHVLVNPRNMNLPENQNNFPSKIMEYLASGRRIISTRFVGHERFEGIICFCEANVFGLREKIQEETGRFRENTELYQRQKIFAGQFDWSKQIERVIQEADSEQQMYKYEESGQSVCIVIPIYKEVPSETDRVVIANIINQMECFDIYFAVPKGLNLNCYQMYDVKYKFFEKKHFKSEKSYSRLLLKPMFYEVFREYEYMLIAQTDTWIFKMGTELAKFVCKGYDYIGAPWHEGIEVYPVAFKGLSYVSKYMRKRKCYVGNGGLSLRNIQKTCMLLREKKRYTFLWNTGEDVFFAYHGQDNKCDFHIAPIELARQFALEKDAKEWIRKGEMPFGVHGWDKYYPELIQDRENR